MTQVKTLIINLPRSVERRKYMLSVTDRFPFLDVELIEATDGSKLTQTERDRYIHPEYSKLCRTTSMTNGELGCALSHCKCYQYISDQGLPFALVLEDDVLIGEHFAEGVKGVSEFLRSKQKPTLVLLSARTTCMTQPIWSEAPLSIHKAFAGIGGYGYMLNRSAAEVLLAKSVPFRVAADDWYHHRQKGIELYAVIPHVTSYEEDRSESTLNADRHKMWLDFCTKIKQNSSFLARLRYKYPKARLMKKLFKVVFRAKDYEKLWP